MSVEVRHGDCIEVMASLEPDSFAACVTDPPYLLEFMGKSWDRPGSEPFGVTPFEAWFAGFVAGEGCFRVQSHKDGKYFTCAFSIHLRADESPILRRLQAKLGGRIVMGGERTNKQGVVSKPDVRWVVETRDACWAVARILDRAPLFAKKANDYRIWRRALQIWTDTPKGSRWHGPRDVSEMAVLHRRLQEVKRFDEEVVDLDFDPFMPPAQAFHYQWAREVYRVLKPGAYLCAFGGTRTYHRMVCAIEDAGFVIHPMLAWIFASGFPKAHDLSKAIDRAAGAEREVVGRYAHPRDGYQWHDGTADGTFTSAHTNPERSITAPATAAAREWVGWAYGLQSLKPAIEPICLAQKPFADVTSTELHALTGWDHWHSARSDGNDRIITGRALHGGARSFRTRISKDGREVSREDLGKYVPFSLDGGTPNVLKHGTGALNIDASRISPSSRPADEASCERLRLLCSRLDSGDVDLERALDCARHIAAALRPCNMGGTDLWRNATGLDGRSPWDDPADETLLCRLLPNVSWHGLNWSAALGSPDHCSACSRRSDELSRRLQEAAQVSVPSLADALERTCSELREFEHIRYCQCSDHPSSLGAVRLAGSLVSLLIRGALNMHRMQLARQESTVRVSNAGTNGEGWGMGKSAHLNGSELGRWPANVAHSGDAQVMQAFARFGVRAGSGGESGNSPSSKTNGVYGEFSHRDPYPKREDTGTAARFFKSCQFEPDELRFHFCGKATAEDRCGSKHPTQKPISLMEWLVTLVTPPGGRVLDPFAGTGSTLVACDRLGFDALGIEQDAQTVADAEEKIRRFRARRAIGPVDQPAAVAVGQAELGL